MTEPNQNPIIDRLRVARTDPPPYQDRYLAFVDILGWKNYVTRSVEHPHLLAPISEAAELISMAREWAGETNANFKRIADAGATSKYVAGGEPFDGDIRVTHFSDTFVLTAPVRQTSQLCLPHMVSVLTNRLLEAGLCTRGAIVRGLVHHTDRAIYGPALMHAYELERDVANYPRVLVDASAEWLFELAFHHRTDFDGLKHIDTLRAYSDAPTTINWLEPILDASTLREREHASNSGIFAKHRWMTRYIQSTIAALANK
jgi:hypothetical protein